MTSAWGILGLLLGWSLLCLLLGYRIGQVKRRLKYRWECTKPGCGFHIESSEPDFTLLMAERHERGVHGA